MQFIDEAIIEVTAGDGGDGCVAFRREKYRPNGGPSGGNGGKGADIYLRADHNLSTLLDLHYTPQYKAQRGEHGRGRDQHGRGGSDLILRVPTGTLVYDAESGDLIVDLVEHGQTHCVAKGGRGGRGNMEFVTSTRQAPDFAEEGQPGEHLTLRLELKLLADVGVIGFPNVGKSTLIAHVSKAQPKIADYPFTTLTPNLGVVRAPGREAFVMADVPGLIEGAHQGTGLGIRFLRHVERTRVFLHLLELAEDGGRDPIRDYEVILRELELYDQSTGSALAENPMIVALNKVEDDALAEICQEEIGAYFAEREIPFFVISAHTGRGITPLLHALTDMLEDQKRQEQEGEEEEDSSWDPLAQP